MDAGSTLRLRAASATPVAGYDQLAATGTVDISGATLAIDASFNAAESDTFTLIDNDGADAVIGTFAGLTEGATVNVGTTAMQITYAGGTGNDVVLRVPDVTAPVVAISAPLDASSTTASSVELTYTVTDARDPLPVCNPAQVTSSMQLALGLNTLTVTCADAAGNVGVTSVTVTRVAEIVPRSSTRRHR